MRRELSSRGEVGYHRESMQLNPQFSLIPTVLALSDFFIQNFPHITWYPYWYLGNPYHYLIGPVVPILLLALSKILFISLYHIYIEIIVAGMGIGSIGIYYIVRDWHIQKRRAILSAVLYFVGPFSWLILYYQNGLKQIAFALIPFLFLFYRRYLLKRKVFHLLAVITLAVFSLLISINSMLAIVVGMAGILFA